MSVNLRTLAPALSEQLQSVTQVPVVRFVNETVWLFAIIETAHLLFMAVLGGSVFVLNFRLLDAGLREVPVKAVERATRPWFRVGVAGTIITGTIMAIATTTTVLGSASFLVKMIALVAAILLSASISRQIRHGDGLANTARLSGVAALAIALWAAALALFVATVGTGPGALLVALVGFALFAVLLERGRVVYLACLGAIIMLGLWISDALTEGWAVALIIGGSGLLAATFGVWRLKVTSTGNASGKLAFFSSMLAWVTVAAAGRWIGFS